MAKPAPAPSKITPQQIENQLRALQDDLQGRVDEKKTSIATVAAGGAVVLMIIFFLLGKRSGRKRSTVVEIRRI
jgi:hypothetical protein